MRALEATRSWRRVDFCLWEMKGREEAGEEGRVQSLSSHDRPRSSQWSVDDALPLKDCKQRRSYTISSGDQYRVRAGIRQTRELGCC